FLKRVCR
ncbi:hypothetical protein D046_6528C, partial [Vibrio parahaemolyticus V-223/04]